MEQVKIERHGFDVDGKSDLIELVDTTINVCQVFQLRFIHKLRTDG